MQAAYKVLTKRPENHQVIPQPLAEEKLQVSLLIFEDT